MYNAAIVDDEIWSVNYLKNIVDWEQEGFRIIGAFTKPSDVVSLIQSGTKIDILLIDICLTKTSGLEFVEQNRSALSKTVIVFVTAYDIFKYAKKAIDLGATEYLLKPVEKNDIKQLLKKTRRILEKASAPVLDSFERYMKRGEPGKLLTGSGAHALCAASVPEQTAEKLCTALNECGLKTQLYTIWQINHALLMEGNQNQLENAVAILRKELSQFSVGISMHSEPVSLWQLSCETEDAFNGTFFYDRDFFCTYDHRNDDLAAQYIFLLQSYLKENRPDLARKLIATVMSDMQSKHLDAGVALKFYNHLYTSLLSVTGADGVHYRLLTSSSLIQHEFRNKLHFQDALTDMTTQLFGTEINKHYQITAKEMVPKIQQYIKEHYKKNLSLTMLAKEFIIPEKYLSSIFKKVTGQNLTDYIHRVRMDESKVLLKSTSLNIQDIAFLCGYSDYYKFTKIFKRYESVTPSEYRINQTGKEDGKK